MTYGFRDHVGQNHPEVSTYPKRFITKNFEYCPYCGEQL